MIQYKTFMGHTKDTGRMQADTSQYNVAILQHYTVSVVQVGLPFTENYINYRFNMWNTAPCSLVEVHQCF
jgi:hypothetical protein